MLTCSTIRGKLKPVASWSRRKAVHFDILLVFLLFRCGLGLIEHTNFVLTALSISLTCLRFLVDVGITISKFLCGDVIFLMIYIFFLEKGSVVLEVMVHQVTETLRSQSLIADLRHVGCYLCQHGVREGGDVSQVVQQKLQHKILPTSENQATKLTAMDFPQEQHLREGRESNSQESKDDPDNRDDQQHHPPKPEGEEVLLVKYVVPKNAEEILIKRK